MIAVDSHLHILDPRFEGRNGARVPAGMAVSDYKKARAVYGTNRAVVVQSKSYGTDPACLLDALAQFGTVGRGIAAPDPSLSDETLEDLDAASVRGVRFSRADAAYAIPALYERLEETGYFYAIRLRAN
jgi:D-galactarolactone isomerase